MYRFYQCYLRILFCIKNIRLFCRAQNLLQKWFFNEIINYYNLYFAQKFSKVKSHTENKKENQKKRTLKNRCGF